MKDAKFSIREGTVGDVRALADMLRDFSGVTPGDASQEAEFLAQAARNLKSSPGQRLYIAEDTAGKPIGFEHAIASGLEGRPFITTLYTRPESRGLGVGTALMEKAEDWIRQLGKGEMHLFVSARKETARHLYEHRGYTTYFNQLAAPPSGDAPAPRGSAPAVVAYAMKKNL